MEFWPSSFPNGQKKLQVQLSERPKNINFYKSSFLNCQKNIIFFYKSSFPNSQKKIFYKSRFPNSQKKNFTSPAFRTAKKNFTSPAFRTAKKYINFTSPAFRTGKKIFTSPAFRTAKKIFLSKNFTSPEVGGRLGYSRKARKPSPTCFRGRILDEPGYFLGLLHFCNSEKTLGKF